MISNVQNSVSVLTKKQSFDGKTAEFTVRTEKVSLLKSNIVNECFRFMLTLINNADYSGS